MRTPHTRTALCGRAHLTAMRGRLRLSCCSPGSGAPLAPGDRPGQSRNRADLGMLRLWVQPLRAVGGISQRTSAGRRCSGSPELQGPDANTVCRTVTCATCATCEGTGWIRGPWIGGGWSVVAGAWRLDRASWMPAALLAWIAAAGSPHAGSREHREEKKQVIVMLL